MNANSICLSTRNPILFGRGASARAGRELRNLNVTKALVVCDEGVKAAGILRKILDSLDSVGIEYAIYDKAQPDPPDWSCEEAAELGRREKVDGVIAVGGGSSLDTGKAACILLTNPSPISRYYLAAEVVQPDEAGMYPVVVIPTTSGTGSEATPGGVITDTANNAKRNIPCASSLGIVDPELTLTLPLSVTAVSAIDALCHAAEAYTSNKPNAICDVLNERAIGLIGKCLPRVFEAPDDIEAREGLQLAATLAGLGIMGPFCHIPHEIGLIISMMFHMAHGAACGMTLPEGLEYVAPAVPDRVAHVARLLGGEVPPGADPEEIGRIAYDTVAGLFKIVNFPKFPAFATRQEVIAAAPRIMDPYPFIHSPRDLKQEDVERILAKAYDRGF